MFRQLSFFEKKINLQTFGKSFLRFSHGVAHTSARFSLLSADSIKLVTPAALRGRSHLPGSDSPTFPKYLQQPRENFPYAMKAELKPSYHAVDWGNACKEELNKLLPKYGAVLFRNLPLKTPLDFENFFIGTGMEKMRYLGGSGFRANVQKELYTASDEPPEYSIELHNELSYSPVYNKTLFFMCLTPPQSKCGGESAICYARDILDGLDEYFVAKAKEKGIRYIRNCADATTSNYCTWQACFEASTKQEAEAVMKERGYDWEWQDDSSLCFWYTLPAFMKHPETGEDLWFNQCHSHHATYYKAHPDFIDLNMPDKKFPMHSTYGDSEKIEPEFLQQIRELGWKNAVGFQWNAGDVLVLDNWTVQHARLGFQGPRKLLCGLAVD